MAIRQTPRPTRVPLNIGALVSGILGARQDASDRGLLEEEIARQRGIEEATSQGTVAASNVLDFLRSNRGASVGDALSAISPGAIETGDSLVLSKTLDALGGVGGAGNLVPNLTKGQLENVVAGNDLRFFGSDLGRAVQNTANVRSGTGLSADRIPIFEDGLTDDLLRGVATLGPSGSSFGLPGTEGNLGPVFGSGGPDRFNFAPFVNEGLISEERAKASLGFGAGGSPGATTDGSDQQISGPPSGTVLGPDSSFRSAADAARSVTNFGIDAAASNAFLLDKAIRSLFPSPPTLEELGAGDIPTPSSEITISPNAISGPALEPSAAGPDSPILEIIREKNAINEQQRFQQMLNLLLQQQQERRNRRQLNR